MFWGAFWTIIGAMILLFSTPLWWVPAVAGVALAVFYW